MSTIASQNTSLAIVYSTIYSRRRSKKPPKPRITGLCGGNSPETGEFLAQGASYAGMFPFDDVIMYIWRDHCMQPQARNPIRISNQMVEVLGSERAEAHFRSLAWSSVFIVFANSTKMSTTRHISQKINTYVMNIDVLICYQLIEAWDNMTTHDLCHYQPHNFWPKIFIFWLHFMFQFKFNGHFH